MKVKIDLPYSFQMFTKKWLMKVTTPIWFEQIRLIFTANSEGITLDRKNLEIIGSSL